MTIEYLWLYVVLPDLRGPEEVCAPDDASGPHGRGESARLFRRHTIDIFDPITGEAHAMKLFVAAMGASNCTYAEPCPSESPMVERTSLMNQLPALLYDAIGNGVLALDRFYLVICAPVIAPLIALRIDPTGRVGGYRPDGIGVHFSQASQQRVRLNAKLMGVDGGIDTDKRPPSGFVATAV